jgi:crotonobetainyl-CoA:carnitine CoA-transferase CaiB-like acyl-CoA transferase
VQQVLSGVRVLDLCEQVPGPYSSRLLAGLGADVIKVERPGAGDPLRARPFMFEAENRGKRDLCLDLKSAAGRSALLAVAAKTDVFIEGFRPGVTDRLGVGFDDVVAVNPKIIYASISGFGASGPYRDLPGHDFQYLSYAGGIPAPEAYFAADYVPTTLPVADMGASVFATLSIVLALHERQRDPQSFAARHLDIGMSDCTLALMEPRIAEALSEPTSAAALVRPGYGVYRTADDRYVSIGALEDHFWTRMTTALGLDELGGERYATWQQRREHIADLEAPLRDRVATFDRDVLIDLLVKVDVPVAPVNDLHEAAADPHARARGMVYDVPGGDWPRVAEWPVALAGFADRDRLTRTPQVGQHSREVLRECGLTEAELDSLVAAGAIHQA